MEAYALVTEENPKFDQLDVHYKNNNGNYLFVGYVGLNDNKRFGIGGEVIDSVILKNGTKANLRDKGIDFLYDNDQMVVYISGLLSREELIKMANHIK
ncbi:hypothetical protein JCM10914A_42350 [Paenibacillus sp. JCM 10914]